MGAIAPKFTWSNKREGQGHVKERLDRAMGNTEWRLKFPEANFYVLTVGTSDHSPIMFVPNTQVSKLPHPIRFHDMWFEDEECEEVIRLKWIKNKNDTDEKIASTLKILSKDLTKWNKNKFGNVDRCIN